MAKGRLQQAARFKDNFEEEKKEESLGSGTNYTTRYCGTSSAGCLRTDSAWNLSLRENAMDIALTSKQKAARSLAQAKTVNNLAVPIRITAVHIVQQPAALIDHHDQSAARYGGGDVGLEMRGQVVDPLAQKGD